MLYVMVPLRIFNYRNKIFPYIRGTDYFSKTLKWDHAQHAEAFIWTEALIDNTSLKNYPLGEWRFSDPLDTY